MHNRSKDHCIRKTDVPLMQRQSPFPRYTRDVVPNTAGIQSTLNPFPWYYHEFQPHFCGNTADIVVITQIKLPCHSFSACITCWRVITKLNIACIHYVHIFILLNTMPRVNRIYGIYTALQDEWQCTSATAVGEDQWLTCRTCAQRA